MRFLVLLLLSTVCAQAHDNGQYAQVDPETRAWVKGLKDHSGVPCCDTADGYDVQWETRGDKYFVFIKGVWIEVPDKAKLDTPNKLGVARV